MSDDDIALDEKRIYEERRAETRAYVACELGVATVAVSDDQIGRFGLEHQCTARDVAGADGQLAVATDEDVLVGDGDGEFVATDFGPAAAVGLDGTVVAASPEGTVARLDGDEWVPVGSVDDPRAIDGDLVAAGDGVFRIGADSLDALTDSAARDVAAAGPYASTSAGILSGADDWAPAVAGDGTVVASDGDRAHAVVDGELLARDDDGWDESGAAAEGVVDVAYAGATIAVTADGVVAIDPVTAKDGAPEWRSRSLGLSGVVGVAVP